MFSLSKFIKDKKMSLLNNCRETVMESKVTEARLLWLLNFLSIQKIIFLAIVYKIWIDLAQVGFDNTYSIFSLISADNTIKNTINESGSLIFKNYLFILIIYTIFKSLLLSDKENIDYIGLLNSIKRKLSSILRLGTLFLMAALYSNELSFLYIDRTLGRIISNLLIFVLFYLLEKVMLANIEKRIRNDLEVKGTDIYTQHGDLTDIPLLEFKKESKWSSYVERTRTTHFDFSINADSTGDFLLVDKLALKKVVTNYEFDLYIPLEDLSEEKSEGLKTLKI